jgi:membrane protease YdiL (CAAX protease family)
MEDELPRTEPQLPQAQRELSRTEREPPQRASESPHGKRALPYNDWPWWTAFPVLLAGYVVALVGGLAIEVPAAALGVRITPSYTPHGIELADSIVQELGFVLVAVLFARLGGRALRSWQLGLRPAPIRRAVGLVLLTLLAFLVFNGAWGAAFHVKEEKLLEQLGTNENALLLVAGALLTTVVAPICEETLFRGYIFPALCKWRGWFPAAAITGLLFGAVHAGSAPVEDLVPLAVLGFLLCRLYRQTGSLYPCIATHALNNSLAFGIMESWSWQIPVLVAAALAIIALLWLLLRGVGVISGASTEKAVVAGP